MNETYALGLSILDFMPNLAFLTGSIYLVRLTLMTNDPVCSFTMIAGSIFVFLGGILQATWKFLYTIGVGDYQILSDLQFVLMSPGFLFLLISVILLARQDRKEKKELLAMAVWKIPLLAIMTISSLGFQGILSYLSFGRKANIAGILYIVAIVCMLGMAGMASYEQSVAMQWVEESTNTIGQIAYALGSFLLYRQAKTEGRLQKT